MTITLLKMHLLNFYSANNWFFCIILHENECRGTFTFCQTRRDTLISKTEGLLYIHFHTWTDLLFILHCRMLQLMSLWPLPSKLRQQHSQRSAEIVSAACWLLWIVGCFVLPSYLYGWETVMSFCSLALLFCASTSFWLWTDCEVLHSVDILSYFVVVFCKKQNTAWFNTSGWLNP